ncbi:MAG: N-succinylarginine dihydrolase [Verrucomicrobia bacterium]|nr:N-succinylarginine dihydrolase [Verrucomicrobiota bacterium]
MSPQTTAYQVNIDGLIGPTHHYGGLSLDNAASLKSANTVANPKKAALQGLYKMKLLADLGVKQMVLPLQERPDLHTLRCLGFSGSDVDVVAKAYKEAPRILSACYSASGAFAANAATISPSSDAEDGRVHITPANLAASFHRSLEPLNHGMALTTLFPHIEAFVHHEPLPSHPQLGDEGAANWIRLGPDYGKKGVELFVYGGRQAFEASKAVARLHLLKETVFAEQNPHLIDQGVIHNDIVAVGNQNVLLYYDQAWIETKKVIEDLRKKMETGCQRELIKIPISSDELSAEDLISSYLFNAQLITLPSQEMALICPLETKANPHTQHIVDRIIADPKNPIGRVLYVDLNEGMKNGGGPSCFRLPALLTESEIAASHKGAFLDEGLYRELVEWINSYYREELSPKDLADPLLIEEALEALDTLTEILGTGPLYRFQTFS